MRAGSGKGPVFEGARAPVARVIGDSGIRVWGLSPGERLRRSFRRAGIEVLADHEGALSASAAAQVLVRGDHVFDETLITALSRTAGVVLVGRGGTMPLAAHVADTATAEELSRVMAGESALPPGLAAGLRVIGPAELAGSYQHALRKRAPPYVLRLAEESERDAVERRTFGGAYKGVTDFVTKHVWPLPSFWATKAAAAVGLSPNAVTFASLLLVVAAFWLFMEGRFLSGLLAAWLMTFLDTVDGKLARVTLTSTKLGDVFDHGLDLVHPPFWYGAWLAGLHAVAQQRPDEMLLFAVVVGGYVLGRVQEGVFLWRFKIEIHVWEAIDSRFRLITARRNPNLFLLTAFALIGRPALGMVAVAAWTTLSLAFHSVRIAQAFRRRREGPLASWLAAP